MNKYNTDKGFKINRRSCLKFLAPVSVHHVLNKGLVYSANEKTAEDLIDDRTQKAIDKGLRFLSGRQVQRGADRGALGSSGYSGSVGICGLSGLAFMSEGSTPGVGRFGKEVDLCTEFLMRHTGPTGYIARGSGAIGNMYAHGFAMLCMTQAYGMSRKRELGEKLRAAVKCTLGAQPLLL